MIQSCGTDKGSANLQGNQHGVCFADKSYDNTSLLDSFRCIFDLKYSSLR
jgi:hypothetical protein